MKNFNNIINTVGAVELKKYKKALEIRDLLYVNFNIDITLAEAVQLKSYIKNI